MGNPGHCEESARFSVRLEWRSKQKKGARKAIVALARKLLIYTLLKQAPLFDESCFEAKHKSCEKNRFLGTYGN